MNKKKVSKGVISLFFTIALVLPLVFINANETEAALFAYDYKENRGVFAYTRTAEFLTRAEAQLEITYVDPDGNKEDPRFVPANPEGKEFFNRNGTYTIRILINDKPFGRIFYQTIYTNIPPEQQFNNR